VGKPSWHVYNLGYTDILIIIVPSRINYSPLLKIIEVLRRKFSPELTIHDYTFHEPALIYIYMLSNYGFEKNSVSPNFGDNEANLIHTKWKIINIYIYVYALTSSKAENNLKFKSFNSSLKVGNKYLAE